MRMQVIAIGLLLSLTGCAQPSGEAKPELSPELRSLVLDDAPTDIPNPLYIDFNGKVTLLGYALEPERLAPPRSKVQLKLFWRSSSKLAEGYQLYTELVTPGGRRFEVTGTSPLRQGELTPANWEPGKVYVEDVTLTVPEDIDAPRFSIVVGLSAAPINAEAEPTEDAEQQDEGAAEAKAAPGTFGAVHLRVLSGPADAKHGGIVATLDTGVQPGAKRARAAKEEKRGAGAKRPSPVSAKPRDSAARPAAPTPPK